MPFRILFPLLFLISCQGEDPCGAHRHEIKTECRLVGPKGDFYNELDSTIYYTYDAIEVKTGVLFWQDQELQSPDNGGEIVEYCTCSELDK